MKRGIIILFVMVLLVGAGSVSAVDYYVSPTGNDANDCLSYGTPCKTFEKPLDAVGPGDIVYALGGVYDYTNAVPKGNEFSLYETFMSTSSYGTFSAADGTPGNPITIRNYPGEFPVLNFSTFPDSAINGFGKTAVHFRESSYYTFQGFEIIGGVVRVEGTNFTHDIILKENHIHDVVLIGGNANPSLIKINHIDFSTNTYGGPWNIFIWNNILHGVDEENPTVPNKHLAIISVMSREEYQQPPTTAQGGTGYVEIINNTMYDADALLHIKNPTLGPLFVKDNIIYDIVMLGDEGASNMNFTHNLVYNVSWNFETGVYGNALVPEVVAITGNNITIEYNTFIGLQSLVNVRYGKDHNFHNNVFFGVGSGRNYISKSSQNLDNLDPALSSLQTINSDNNCFIVNTASYRAVTRYFGGSPPNDIYNYSEALATFGFDPNSEIIVETDPNLVFVDSLNNDYRLLNPNLCPNMGYYASESPPTNPSVDVNNDGKVNVIDLSLVVFNQNQIGLDYSHLDVNGDGNVNWGDFKFVMDCMAGSCSGGSPWSFKRQITLSPVTPSVDYQVMIDLNPTNFDYSKAKVNGVDIRFFDSSQNSLSYWIENWNPLGNSTVWVEVVNSGDSTIDMLYGNSNALDASNGDSTFELFDDFSGWSRDSNNPVFVKNASIPWETLFVNAPLILKNLDGTPYTDANGYWMYYIGGQIDLDEPSFDQSGLAFSQDLYNWNRYPGNPVLASNNTLGGYDHGDIQPITVLKDGATWRMWYQSNRHRKSTFPGPWDDNVTISYASSSDGINWVKYSGNPILEQGIGDDIEDLYAPVVIKDGATWKMWYTGQNGSNANGAFRLMYATAPNPEGPWTKFSNNYIFDPGYDFYPSEVWKENGIYYMLFFNAGLLDVNYRIGLATSTDGISWTDTSLIFSEGVTGEWDSKLAMWPSQVFVNGKWYSFYTGRASGFFPDIGVATSNERLPTTKDWTFIDKIGVSYENELRFNGISNLSAVEWKSIQKQFVATSETAYTTKIRFDNNLINGQSRYFHVFGNALDKRFGLSISDAGNNLMYLNGSGWIDSGVNLIVGTDYKFIIIYDPIGQTADYYNDGIFIGTGDIGFTDLDTNKITYGSLRTAEDDYSYADNLYVRKYTSPEPATSVGIEVSNN